MLVKSRSNYVNFVSREKVGGMSELAPYWDLPPPFMIGRRI